MNKLLNFTNNFKFLCLLFMFVMMARPAYSIPTTIDEIKQALGHCVQTTGLNFVHLNLMQEKRQRNLTSLLRVRKKF